MLAGIGSLALAAFAPLPTLAAPRITLIHSFNISNGDAPRAALTAAGNGIYYGTTNRTSAIFLFDSVTGSITFQASFARDGSNGYAPEAALTTAGNGIYYGTAALGGANGKGTIFSFDSANSSITLKDSFVGSNGAYPSTALTASGNGIFYGTTQYGGANDNGAIFEFDSGTGSITLKDSFNGLNGRQPRAALTAAGNGIYYGTTTFGGASSAGSIFSFDSATGSITSLADFDGVNGNQPYGALTAGGNGVYYGTTAAGLNGHGNIFSFDSATGSITSLADFDGVNGSQPYDALTAGGNNIYYGTTRLGGTNHNGTIFSFDSSTGSITLQDTFGGSDGAKPLAALTAAGNGIYYGTTVEGGANGDGAIFAFDSGVRDSNPVPGPLPLMGAGAAFGWSRRLRRRIQPVRPVFPIGR